MADLRCGKCQRAVMAVKNGDATTLVKACACEAPIMASMSAHLTGKGKTAA